jgi:hypothetical protein
VVALDVLKYIRRLESAGLPAPQAEAHTEAVSEALEIGAATKLDL